MNDKITSSRQLKAGELIKRSLVSIFREEVFFDHELKNTTITVSEVRMTPDLKMAIVYVFPFAGMLDKKQLMELLNKSSPMLRRLVTKDVSLKYSPELIFKYDESFEQVAKIDQLFEKIHDNQC